MVSLTLSVFAPQWAKDYNRELQRAFDTLGTAPVPFPKFNSDDLPDPAEWPGHGAIATDIPALVFSDGTAWRRADGASL